MSGPDFHARISVYHHCRLPLAQYHGYGHITFTTVINIILRSDPHYSMISLQYDVIQCSTPCSDVDTSRHGVEQQTSMSSFLYIIPIPYRVAHPISKPRDNIMYCYWTRSTIGLFSKNFNPDLSMADSVTLPCFHHCQVSDDILLLPATFIFQKNTIYI